MPILVAQEVHENMFVNEYFVRQPLCKILKGQSWGGSVKRRQFAWQVCKFESKEMCESLRFHCKSECRGSRKLVMWDAVCGAGAAWSRRSAVRHAGQSFSLNLIFVMFVTLGKARRDCFSQCNAGADVVQVHMWCVVTLGEARRDCFSQCNAGADVVQVHMWCVVTLGEARHECFSQCNAGAGSQEVAHNSDSRGRVTVDKLWGGRWLSQEAPVCVAGVGQCASLKVRKCVNPCLLTVNLSAGGRES